MPIGCRACFGGITVRYMREVGDVGSVVVHDEALVNGTIDIVHVVHARARDAATAVHRHCFPLMIRGLYGRMHSGRWWWESGFRAAVAALLFAPTAEENDDCQDDNATDSRRRGDDDLVEVCDDVPFQLELLALGRKYALDRYVLGVLQADYAHQEALVGGKVL